MVSRRQHGFLVLMLLVVNCFKCEAKEDVGRVSAGSAGAWSAHSRLRCHHCHPVLHLLVKHHERMLRSYDEHDRHLRDRHLQNRERNMAKWEQQTLSFLLLMCTIIVLALCCVTRLLSLLQEFTYHLVRCKSADYAKVTKFETFFVGKTFSISEHIRNKYMIIGLVHMGCCSPTFPGQFCA